jgi:hypothetical protein
MDITFLGTTAGRGAQHRVRLCGRRGDRRVARSRRPLAAENVPETRRAGGGRARQEGTLVESDLPIPRASFGVEPGKAKVTLSDGVRTLTMAKAAGA